MLVCDYSLNTYFQVITLVLSLTYYFFNYIHINGTRPTQRKIAEKREIFQRPLYLYYILDLLQQLPQNPSIAYYII